LEGGPPRFRRVSRAPSYSGTGLGVKFSLTGLSPSMAGFIRPVLLTLRPPVVDLPLQPRRGRSGSVGLFRFRSPPTSGISFDLFSFGYCRDVSLPRVPCPPMHQPASRVLPRRVAPFGNPRILGLLAAPRGLSQACYGPSSGLLAPKASSVRP